MEKKDEIHVKHIEWVKKNPDRVSQADRRWRLKNREKVRERNRRYAIRHPDRVKRQIRNWVENNRDKVRAHVMKNCHKRRSKMKNVFVEHVDINVLIAKYSGHCGICADQISFGEDSIDHIVPISLGGKHEYSNCWPAHRRCNAGKSNRYVGGALYAYL